MRDEIEVRLKPGAAPEQCRAISRALARWCALAERARLGRRVRLIIRGGPYLSREQTAAIWRRLLPPGAVEDVVIGGVNWMVDDNDINPKPSGTEVDLPDAATG